MSDEDTPAVKYLREQIWIYFPEVAYHWAAMKNVGHDPAFKSRSRETHALHGVGGFKARTTASGGTSLHASGRAADIYVKVENPLLKAMGDALFAGFVANAHQLGLDQIIWNRQTWTHGHPRITAYHGADPHVDHVHVGFTVAGSGRRPALLVSVLQRAKAKVATRYPQ